jgi:quercetin dioxygenase-like cupin family protein
MWSDIDGARSPEELESLLEDALVLGDPEMLAGLFEEGITLVAGDDPPTRGRAEAARHVLAMWGNDLYVADPQRVVVTWDMALILAGEGIHVAHRDRSGAWRYTIVLRQAGTATQRRPMHMDNTRTPIALAPAEGEALWCVGALTTVKAAAEQTADAFSMIEDLAPKGAGTPLHRHSQDDEAFYVLEGEVTFYLENNEPILAGAGAFVHIPGGTVHAFRVDSETARYLIITTPQHERFYRAIAEPAQTRGIPTEVPLDMERIGAACEAYGVELVGPVPDGHSS